MSDIKKTALFSLEIEADTFNNEILKAKKNISDLTKERDILNTKQKEGNDLTDEENITLTKLNGALAANKKELNDLTSIIQKKTEADLAQQGSQKQMMALYAAAEKELKRLGGTFERAAKGELVLTNANKENTVATNALFQKLKEYDTQLGRNTLNVGNYGGVLTGLKQKIVELDQQRSIATDPEEVMKLTSEIRKLTLQQDQYLGKVDALGQRVAKNDIKDGFQDANSAAMALSGSIGILSLVMGTDSKAGEILRKVMIGVTIAQTALTIAQNKADIQQFLLAAKTKALTAINYLYALSMRIATGAVNGFKVALAATGIGLAVVGIAALIDKLGWFKTKADEATEAQEKLNEAITPRSDRFKEMEKLRAKFLEDKQEEVNSIQQTILALESQDGKEKEILERKLALIRIEEQYQRQLRFSEYQGGQIRANEIYALQLAKERKEIENSLLETKAVNDKKEIEATRQKVTELNILTSAEKDRLNKQIKDDFLASPNIQKAFQNLLGVDDETFKKAWANIGTTIDNSSQGLKGVAENEAIINSLLDEQLKKRIALAEKQEEMKDRALVFSEIMGTAFTGLFQSAEQQQKDFFKNSLLMLLNYFENYFREKLGEMALNQIAQYGVVLGTVRTAIVGAGMFAAFNLAKQQIAGFAEGGLITPEHGAPIQRSNGDNILATVKTGEVILNEPQQQGIKQIAGADVFRKLRVPGFAGGGLILGDGGFSSRSNISQVSNSFELKQAVMDAMRLMPPSIVHVTEINRVQGNVNAVKVNASLNG